MYYNGELGLNRLSYEIWCPGAMTRKARHRYSWKWPENAVDAKPGKNEHNGRKFWCVPKKWIKKNRISFSWFQVKCKRNLLKKKGDDFGVCEVACENSRNDIWAVAAAQRSEDVVIVLGSRALGSSTVDGRYPQQCQGKDGTSPGHLQLEFSWEFWILVIFMGISPKHFGSNLWNFHGNFQGIVQTFVSSKCRNEPPFSGCQSCTGDSRSNPSESRNQQKRWAMVEGGGHWFGYKYQRFPGDGDLGGSVDDGDIQKDVPVFLLTINKSFKVARFVFNGQSLMIFVEVVKVKNS